MEVSPRRETNNPSNPTTPTSQLPMTRSDPSNPYPTTFVQADTNSFKQVVQMLTGSSETATKLVSSSSSKHNNIPPVKSNPNKHNSNSNSNSNSSFKLYDRRHNNNNNRTQQLRLNPLSTPPPLFNYSSRSPCFSPRNTEILSPSILDFPSLALSPVTPLIPDPFDRSNGSSGWSNPNGNNNNNNNNSKEVEEEDRAIKDRGFYLHNSPREAEPPRLLPLFPTTSPRASSGSSSN